MRFDELNKLKSYFSEMKLSPEDIEKRVSLGEDFYDIITYILALMWTDALLNEDLDRDFYINALSGRLIDAIEEKEIPYEDAAIQQLSESVVDTTIEHYTEEEYFDDERALNIAENASNTVNNYSDLINAMENGKKWKIWNTFGDHRVRNPHMLMEGKREPIDGYFYVNGEVMRFPMDAEEASPENYINCRCTMSFE